VANNTRNVQRSKYIYTQNISIKITAYDIMRNRDIRIDIALYK